MIVYRWLLVIASLCGCFSGSACCYDDDLLVATRFGKVRGTTRFALTSHRPVYSFFGVPYARTADYVHRFRPPSDPFPWKGVRNATDENVPICRQDEVAVERLRKNTIFQFLIDVEPVMSEDCLTVNVFSSIHPSKANAVTPIPVMVWVHGGSLQTEGSPQQMWMLPAFEDVVLVTVQYRLGPFGFMRLDHQSAPGNFGLRDQIKALQWVRENIAGFGGDAGSVTAFGESAGGFSVSALALSPVARGLFHRVIAMSGVATTSALWGRNQAEKTLDVAEDVGCKFPKPEQTMTCLRHKASASSIFMSVRNRRYVFLAEEDDGDLFPASASALLRDHAFNSSIALMVGGVSGEFDFILGRKLIPGYASGDKITYDMAKRRIELDIKEQYPHLHARSDLTDRLINEYLDDHDESGSTYVQGLVDYLAHSWFHSKIFQVASDYADAGAAVYVYRFARQPSFYEHDKTASKLTRPYNYDRADHTDDLPFFLGFPFLPSLRAKGLEFTEDECDLSKSMMRAFASFARTGKASFDSVAEWPSFPRYLSIDRKIAIKSGLRTARMNLWKQVADADSSAAACLRSDGTNQPATDRDGFCQQ